jgi:hypothetical protein
MGEVVYEKHGKSYHVIAQPSVAKLYEDTAVPNLEKFHQAINESIGKDCEEATVTIIIDGAKKTEFSFPIRNIEEIQEILQWSIGKDERSE